jgi:hypothetical protein
VFWSIGVLTHEGAWPGGGLLTIYGLLYAAFFTGMSRLPRGNASVPLRGCLRGAAFGSAFGIQVLPFFVFPFLPLHFDWPDALSFTLLVTVTATGFYAGLGACGGYLVGFCLSRFRTLNTEGPQRTSPVGEWQESRAIHKRLLRDEPGYRARNRRIIWLTILYVFVVLVVSHVGRAARWLFAVDTGSWDVVIGVPVTVVATGLYVYVIVRDGVWMGTRRRHETRSSAVEHSERVCQQRPAAAPPLRGGRLDGDPGRTCSIE